MHFEGLVNGEKRQATNKSNTVPVTKQELCKLEMKYREEKKGRMEGGRGREGRYGERVEDTR